MTDSELRDAAWAELRQTTTGWNRVSKYDAATLATTHWGKGKALLDQIGAAPSPPPPPVSGTPWSGWSYEVTGTQYSTPKAPEFVYNPDGTCTLTVFPDTATFPNQSPPAQLLSVHKPNSAQATPGTTRVYDDQITIPEGALWTPGMLNFLREWHTTNGKLSNGIGVVTDYQVFDTSVPGTNPRWHLQANGPAGLRHHYGPSIVAGTHQVRTVIKWAEDTSGRIDMYLNGTLVLTDVGANRWPGDTLGMGVYVYRLKPTGSSPWSLAVTFAEPVVS